VTNWRASTARLLTSHLTSAGRLRLWCGGHNHRLREVSPCSHYLPSPPPSLRSFRLSASRARAGPPLPALAALVAIVSALCG
jgi:hypothetical protein